jgi:biotin-(acetyl-CoA carboxylase) ligase
VRVLRGGTETAGRAEAINDDFSLCLRRDDGTCEAVTGGEVSLRGVGGAASP